MALKIVRDEMVDANWKRRTINQRVHNLRRIFRWGVEHQLLEPNTLAALRAVEALKAGKSRAPESAPICPANPEHVEKAIKFMTPTIAAMVRLQIYTGMRSGEVCRMRTCDIEPTTAKHWIYRPRVHKTAHLGKTREIIMGPKAIKVLKPFLTADLQEHVFSPRKAHAERRNALTAKRKTPTRYGNSVGTNRQKRPIKQPGEFYDASAYRRAVEYAILQAFPPPTDLSRKRGETQLSWRARLGTRWTELVEHRKSVHWHPHQLRHSFATNARNLFSLDHVQKALGHSNASVTQIYAELDRAKAIEVARAMG